MRTRVVCSLFDNAVGSPFAGSVLIALEICPRRGVVASNFVNDQHVPLLQNSVCLCQMGELAFAHSGELRSDDQAGKPVARYTISNAGRIDGGRWA